jgi:acyl carrier protein
MPTVDFDRVAKHLSTLVSVPVERLTPDTTVAELVPDSFTLVEVAVDLQDEFDVVFSQEDLKGVRTLNELAALMASRQQVAPVSGASGVDREAR